MTLSEELKKFNEAEDVERARKKKQKKGFDPVSFSNEYMRNRVK